MKINSIKSTIPFTFFVFLFVLLGVVNPVYSAPWVDAELGSVFTGYNWIRIPGEGGTLFNLDYPFIQEAAVSPRIRLGYDFPNRHSVHLVVAPLTLHYTGTLSEDTLFAGTNFPRDTAIEARFKFNSYRFTYRYKLIQKPEGILALGLTAKIRDAEIALKGSGLEASKTNVGFAPLIHLYLLYNLPHSMFFQLEADALASPQGRAADVHVAVGYTFSPALSIRIGYRFIEGGADIEEIYNFAYLHYATAGLRYTF